MLAANASALTASGLAAFATAELRAVGLRGTAAEVELTAGECVAPLLRAAAIALELSGCLADEHCAGVHDVIVDYISAPPPRPGVGCAPVADTAP
jgi:hypothetical protein